VTGRNRRLLSLGLSAALLVALAFAVVMTIVGSAGESTATSTQESARRAEVQRVASAFAVNVNTYSAENVDSYAERVRPLLTDEFGPSFDRAVSGIVAKAKATQLRSKGEVLVTGVSALDSDSATVLVVSDADVTSSVGSQARHFRWQVDLVRQDGKWLVNGFQPM
jgi:Mce-associated membrane protein